MLHANIVAPARVDTPIVEQTRWTWYWRLTTDGHNAYPQAVEAAFWSDIAYATLM